MVIRSLQIARFATIQNLFRFLSKRTILDSAGIHSNRFSISFRQPKHLFYYIPNLNDSHYANIQIQARISKTHLWVALRISIPYSMIPEGKNVHATLVTKHVDSHFDVLGSRWNPYPAFDDRLRNRHHGRLRSTRLQAKFMGHELNGGRTHGSHKDSDMRVHGTTPRDSIVRTHRLIHAAVKRCTRSGV